jgi:hypothetical protein
MATIVLRGGLSLFDSPLLKFIPANILLKKSHEWIEGTINIQNKPYYRLTPNMDNYIEIKNINNNNFLFVNNGIIFNSKNYFGYTINIKLKDELFDEDKQEFFKYYT